MSSAQSPHFLCVCPLQCPAICPPGPPGPPGMPGFKVDSLSCELDAPQLILGNILYIKLCHLMHTPRSSRVTQDIKEIKENLERMERR